MRPFLVFLAIISALPAARVRAQGRAGAPWDSVGQVLGSRAAESGGIYRYNFPRTDFMVRVGGVTVEAGLALGSWAGFGTIGPDTVVWVAARSGSQGGSRAGTHGRTATGSGSGASSDRGGHGARVP